MTKFSVTLSAVFSGLLAFGASATTGASVRVESAEMPTYPYSDPDPVASTKATLYPYWRFDGQSAASTPWKWTAVTLANGLIEVTLLPQIGGKVWGAKDLRTGRNFIYANDAVKFRDIAQRGPWCSGGIEFNFGVTGHAMWTVSPVDWSVRTNESGSVSYFCGGFEWACRTHWKAEVELKPGEDFFTTRFTWTNLGGLPVSRYQWSTSAVTARGNPEMVYPGAHQIDHDGKAFSWPVDEKGVDRSFYANDGDKPAVSWHVIDGDNRFFGIWYPEWKFGMYHRNRVTDKFGRKIFMWSQARSGGIWEDLLTDRAGQYIELQSGRGLQQQTGDCWNTPFKFQTLLPGACDTFEEQWGVAHDEEIFKKAKAFPSNEIGRPVRFPSDYDATSVYALAREGEQRIRYFEYAEGEKLLRKALEKDPCYAPALDELAFLAFRRGEYDEAERLSAKALAVDAYDGAANFVSGELARIGGKTDRARERYGMASLDAGYRPAALLRLGELEGRVHELYLSSRKLACERPEETFIEGALACLRAGRTKEAAALLDRCGKSPKAALLRGDYAAVEKLPVDFVFPFRHEEIAALRKAMTASDNWKFRYYLAIAYRPLGMDAAADRLLEECGDAPDSAVFYLTRGPRRKGAAADADFRKAAEIGDSWRVGRGWIKALLAEGRAEEAIVKSEAYVKRFPKVQTLEMLYAKALYEAKRYEACVRQYRSMKILPDEFGRDVGKHWITANVALADEAYRKGDVTNAAALVERAMEYPENIGIGKPENPEAAREKWIPEHLRALRPVRPYEMENAGRTADEFPPVAALDSDEGWTAKGKNCEGVLSSSTERALFGKGTLHLKYRATGPDPVIRLEPDKPLAVPRDADAVSLWVWGNNLNGREGYGTGAHIPETYPLVEFTLGKERAHVPLARTRHPEWFLQLGTLDRRARELVSAGAKLTAIVVTNGTNFVWRELDYTSLCVFKSPTGPIPLARKAKVPEKACDVVPGNAESKEIEFRFPAKPLESWDDLAVRYRGGEWIPLAVGGGIYPEKLRGGAKVTFSRKGDSAVVDVEAPAGVEEVRFGTVKCPAEPHMVAVPYLTYLEYEEKENRPYLLAARVDGKPFFLFETADWTVSNASEPMRSRGEPGRPCGGMAYLPKTDGTRNPVKERFAWSVGATPAEVLPNAPNRPSPYLKDLAKRVRYVRFESNDRRADKAFLTHLKDLGMTDLYVTGHEVGMRDGNESFTFRTEPAPKKGGVKGAREYADYVMNTLGFRLGCYNNYTDYVPVNRHWTVNAVTRGKDGGFVETWYRCYAPKPSWILAMNERIIPVLKKEIGYNGTYCDVHTCAGPWERVDYDARAPEAGTFGGVYRAFTELMEKQRETWGGPICSEGGCHYLYAGTCDTSYAQDPQYGLSKRPWLVDFDLLKMHHLSANSGAGLLDQFYCWWRTVDDTHPDATKEYRLTRFLAATLAFGHIGYLEGWDDESMLRSYRTIRPIQEHYVLARPAKIEYGDARHALKPTAEAVLDGSYALSRVRVTYDNGTVVAVNGSEDGDFEVEVKGVKHLLPPNGWYCVSGDGTVVVARELIDNRTVESVRTGRK